MASAESPQAVAALAAQALRRGAWLDVVVAFGWMFAIALWLLAPTMQSTRAFVLASAFAGFATMYYSVRVRLDAAIFASWASADDIDAAMRAFDERLAQLRPRRPVLPRTLAERVAGARRLLSARRGWCGMQVAAILAAIVTALPGAH